LSAWARLSSSSFKNRSEPGKPHTTPLSVVTGSYAVEKRMSGDFDQPTSFLIGNE
jgi:hypothetical protein